ncbi:MAG: hypothetical protein M0P61_18625 [Ignavibacteriaceae bacterium]|nr:hypothetical protein [Ignavibacteriaceae bacterium]
MTSQLRQFPHSGKAFPKIIALWALNEAALGGLLHAFDIPFTGLIVGGVASVLIALLAFLSDKRGSITKATLIVIVIKAVVSPYTPLAAFVAVFIQGLLGELLFSSKKFFAVSAITLAVLSSMYSALQKLFLVTILFGTTLWKSIDLFFNYVLKQLSFLGADIHFSYYLIAFYLMLHLIFGTLFGIIAARIPKVVSGLTDSSLLIPLERIKIVESESLSPAKKKKKFWFQKISGIIVFVLLLTALFISYFYTEHHNGNVSAILVTIFRAIGITLLWFFFFGPIALKYFKKLIASNQNKYTVEIESILQTLPYYKKIIQESFSLASSSSGIARLKLFAKLTLINILFFDLHD